MRILLPVLLLALPTAVGAVDGVIEINQASASAAGYPVQISAPGSYRLTSDLSPPPDIGGIRISASNVTLDLNGFTLSISGSAARNAISDNAGATIRQIVVRNGTLVNSGTGSGVRLDESENVRIEDLTVRLSGTAHIYGINVGVPDPADTTDWLSRASIARCVVDAETTGTALLAAGERARVEGCTLEGPSATGILVGDGATLIGNEVHGAGDGISILRKGLSNGATVRGNSLTGVGSSGTGIDSDFLQQGTYSENTIALYETCANFLGGVFTHNRLGCGKALTGVSSISITGNRITASSGNGIEGSNMYIASNDVSTSLGSGVVGIVATDDSLIRDNLIRSKNGVWLVGTGNILRGNLIAYSNSGSGGAGVEVQDASASPEISGNRFLGGSLADDIDSSSGASPITFSASPNVHSDGSVLP